MLVMIAATIAAALLTLYNLAKAVQLFFGGSIHQSVGVLTAWRYGGIAIVGAVAGIVAVAMIQVVSSEGYAYDDAKIYKVIMVIAFVIALVVWFVVRNFVKNAKPTYSWLTARPQQGSEQDDEE